MQSAFSPRSISQSGGISQLSITTERTSELVGNYGKSPADTGSTAAQVAILSERIRNLTTHLQLHKRDFATRRGLLMLIGKRRRLLDYLQRQNADSYSALIKDLELRR